MLVKCGCILSCSLTLSPHLNISQEDGHGRNVSNFLYSSTHISTFRSLPAPLYFFNSRMTPSPAILSSYALHKFILIHFQNMSTISEYSASPIWLFHSPLPLLLHPCQVAHLYPQSLPHSTWCTTCTSYATHFQHKYL